MFRQLFLVFTLLIPGLSVCQTAQSDIDHSQISNIDADLKVIDGKMVVAFELVSRSSSQHLSFLVEPDQEYVIAVHPQVHEFMRLQRGEREVRVVSVNGGHAPVDVRGIGVFPDVDTLQRASELFSAELNDVILAGALGAGFLRNFLVEINIDKGNIKLSSPRDPGADVEELGELVLQGEVGKNGSLSFPGGDGDKNPVRFGFSGDYSTSFAVNERSGIDAVYLRDMKANSSQSINVADYVAFRQRSADADNSSEQTDDADKGTSEQDNATLKLGISFMKHFRVVIDYKNQYLGLTQTAPPVASAVAEEQKFYSAEAQRSPAALVDFLEKHPTSEHAEEASLLLMDWRIEDRAGEAEIIEAARWVRDTAPEKGRGKYMMDLMDRMQKERADDYRLAIAVGEMGLNVVRQDGDPGNLYRLHNLLGETRMRNGDIHGAWRHFLSAAFGMSRSPEINLNLGLVYEEKGRVRRAYSRYRRALELHTYNLENRLVEAVMNEKDVAAAYLGLMRLESELDHDDPLLDDL